MPLNLNLIFITHSKTNFIKKYKLSFQKKAKYIKKDKISIPIHDNIFKHGKDKAVISIRLYYDSIKGQKSKAYKFNLYYGNNSIYIRVDILSSYVYEIILKNMKDIKIENGLFEFKECDNLENKNRKRLVLINYDSNNIIINGKEMNLRDIVIQNSLEYKWNFNQISVQDLENEIYIVQPIKEKTEYDINFLKN